MKKNYLRSIIIVLIQTLLPIIALFLLTPLLINQLSLFQDWLVFINKTHTLFLISHFLFYIMLIGLWPKLLTKLKHEETSLQQFQLAIQTRWYLVAIFMISEIIINVGVH